MAGLLSMAQQFSGLPMESLIGSPLQAATQANATMATTQVNFLKAVCFNKAKLSTIKDTNESDNTFNQYIAATTDEEGYTPIMVNMVVSRQLITGEQKDPKISTTKSLISLPILTLIPLNSLAVTEADITFDMEVKSSTSNDTSRSNSSSTDQEGKFSATAKYNAGFFSVSATVSGSISKKTSSESKESSHYAASNKAHYTVNVKAGQLPLPDGVKTIIEAYSKAIAPIDMTTSTEPQDQGNKK